MSDRGRSRRNSASAPATNRSYHHGNVRAAIVAAALDVLSGAGPSKLSLRDLARTVGVRHSALYSHFRDREELLAVIAGEGFRALLNEMQKGLAKKKGDRLIALASAYLQFARLNAAHYRTMFLPENILPQNSKHVKAVSDECFQILIDVLLENPAITRQEAVERGVGIWSTLHGLILLGDNSGPLHQKIPCDQESLLAEKFVQVLARESWRKKSSALATSRSRARTARSP